MVGETARSSYNKRGKNRFQDGENEIHRHCQVTRVNCETSKDNPGGSSQNIIETSRKRYDIGEVENRKWTEQSRMQGYQLEPLLSALSNHRQLEKVLPCNIFMFSMKSSNNAPQRRILLLFFSPLCQKCISY